MRLLPAKRDHTRLALGDYANVAIFGLTAYPRFEVMLDWLIQNRTDDSVLLRTVDGARCPWGVSRGQELAWRRANSATETRRGWRGRVLVMSWLTPPSSRRRTGLRSARLR
jgi:hypothetical protein